MSIPDARPGARAGDFPLFFFFNDTATTEIYTLSLHDALPISTARRVTGQIATAYSQGGAQLAGYSHQEIGRAHVELQSRLHLVCRLLLEKKKKKKKNHIYYVNAHEY